MGMRAMTDDRGVKVWKDEKAEYPRFSFSISKKNEEGKYENFYMEIKFKKGIDLPENGDEIIIKDSFMSFNVGKDGRKYPYLMVLDCVSLTEHEDQDFMKIPDSIEEALPFK